MTFDPGVVGPLAATLMDDLADDFGDDAEIRSVLVAVEVDTEDATHTRWKVSPNSSVTVAGMAAQLTAGATAGERP